MSSNRELVNKFGCILPYYEDHLRVPAKRNLKDMGKKRGAKRVYSFYLLCKKREEWDSLYISHLP